MTRIAGHGRPKEPQFFILYFEHALRMSSLDLAIYSMSTFLSSTLAVAEPAQSVTFCLFLVTTRWH